MNLRHVSTVALATSDLDPAVEIRDRLVHVWTDTANYRVSVHVEAPSGVDGLDGAGDVLTADFEVRMP